MNVDARALCIPTSVCVEHTFIEIEVIEKAVRFINNDSIHKRIHQHVTAAAHPTNSARYCWPDIVMPCVWPGILS